MFDLNEILVLISIERPWIFPLFVGVFGGVFGSFLTCMLYRVPRSISLANPPSHCPNCNTKLKMIDLVPVFSYLAFKGKCHYCKMPVSARYVLIEVLTVVIFVVAYILVGVQLALFPALILSVSLMFAIGLYIESKLIATKVLLFSIIVTCVFIYLVR